MFTVISYDIVEDKRRTKVLKLLKGYGTHVQYSVFECFLSEKQLEQLGGKLRALIDLDTDSVRCYRLDVAALKRIRLLGVGRVSEERLYYLVSGADKMTR
jgi:CRISPR-associated protein Cas2